MENNKRPETMARINTPELARQFIDEQVSSVLTQVGLVPAAWIRRWWPRCSSAPSASSWYACM